MTIGASWHRTLAAAALFAAALSIGGPVPAEESHDHGAHHHMDQRALPEGAAIPTLVLEAKADSVSGYNLHLVVTGFAFSPENLDQDNEGIEGHAHLYVNGEKVSRLYGHWVHLPMALFAPGDNQVRVTLNDNLHRLWTQDGRPIEAIILLAGPSS